jgi:hypothetical protein
MTFARVVPRSFWWMWPMRWTWSFAWRIPLFVVARALGFPIAVAAVALLVCCWPFVIVADWCETWGEADD